ncbi:DNA mismatch repair endonuclease MutL [Luteolibacter sp. SL250]|uniref:DNA mismatch repair endonuclease MutL n=1 Tax=Luteolibacter sp. SL250 TaxID=2995170 RepID=UPI00226FC76F|nr:DNA mismatch repair endonuclease MutL [Luteolibacter sp. SL250]WAC21608.1 DNA mismatch repair endonuclease MutL [Luteolibacter sp. SL250]
MPKIRVLSDILASQVAAGEVVERPASVVKELVENSIDAGAGEIRVDTDRGGAALIRVSDDGCGMSREDALLSLERHATSKLRTSADLGEIRTLGFRGEAVPSIASVSRFRMVTREAGVDVGTEISVDGGTVRDVRDAGCAPGTVIEAKALFFNMPARKKFMRAESTESAHIEHQVRLHALAAPQVRFRLRRDDREVFDLPPADSAIGRVRQIVGTDLARELITVPETRGNGVSVTGLLLPTVHARKGRRHQFVFLNGRPVEDSVISRALVEGFRGGLADGMQPAAWLWIDLEPSLVDVNVHPAKREVRFRRPLDVRDVILEAVADALRPPAATVANVANVAATAAVVEPAAEVKPLPMSQPVREAAPAVRPWAAVARAVQPLLPVSAPERTVPEEMEETRLENPAPARFRVLALLHQRYILLESADGLVVFDPKAAHERILYEGLLRRHAQGISVQGLLVPVLIELDPRDLDAVLKEREALAEIGIEVAAFGGNTLQISGLPASIPVDQPVVFMRELLDDLLHDGVPGKRFAFERLAKLLARKAAQPVKASLREAGPLLDELFLCELPYCAADGRPTLSEFSLQDLARRFSGGRELR